MALVLSEAITQVRYVLNEVNAVFWTDSEITAWIAEGTRIVASKTHCVEAEDDITLATDQLIYTSSDHAWIADCIVPYAGIYAGTSNKYKGMQFVHPKQIGNLLTYTPGEPKYYSFHNRSFYIWPLPTSTENGDTISILYATESDDITALKDEWQHLPILWAQAKAYEKDRMNSQGAALRSQFFSELQYDKADKLDRPGEPPNNVKAGVPFRGKANEQPRR